MKKFQPFLKAITPAVLTVVTVAIKWAINGTFDKQTATIAITGLVASAVTYFVPNIKADPSPSTPPSQTSTT